MSLEIPNPNLIMVRFGQTWNWKNSMQGRRQGMFSVHKELYSLQSFLKTMKSYFVTHCKFEHLDCIKFWRRGIFVNSFIAHGPRTMSPFGMSTIWNVESFCRCSRKLTNDKKFIPKMVYVLSSIQLIFQEFKIGNREPFPVPKTKRTKKMILQSKNQNLIKCQW